MSKSQNVSAITCLDPTPGAHMLIDLTGYEVNDLAILSCSPGYRLPAGDTHPMCNASGHWEGIVRACESRS